MERGTFYTFAYEENQSAFLWAVCESLKGIAEPSRFSLYVPHKKSIQSSLWREINGMKLYLETGEEKREEEKKFPGLQ